MDEGCSRNVQEVFVSQQARKALIYRSNYIIQLVPQVPDSPLQTLKWNTRKWKASSRENPLPVG